MSRGYWFSAIAFGLIILHSAIVLADPPKKETQQRKASAKDIKEKDFLIRKAEADASSINADSCYQGNNHNNDFCAQWRATFAAEKANSIGTIGIILSGIGAISVFIAIGLAFQANRISRKIGEAQVRAYVHFSNIKPTFEGSDIRLHIDWENTGQSPAKRAYFGVNASMDIEIGRTEFPLVLSNSHVTTIAAGRTSDDVSILISNEMALASRYDGILVWGAIEYDDVFTGSARHRTEFCVIISDVTANSDGSAGRQISTYGNHNGADEDCMFPPTT